MTIIKVKGIYKLQDNDGFNIPAFIRTENDCAMRDYLLKYRLHVHTENNLDAYYGYNLEKAMSELD